MRGRQLRFTLIAMAIYAACLHGIFGIAHAADARALAQPRPLSTKTPEVIGGRVVAEWESPWQVALVLSGAINHVDGVFCGGTLLDSQWVLTAAHCFYDPDTCVKFPTQRYYVAYGSTDLGKKVSLVAAAEVFHPKDYDCKKKEKDIALLRLQEPVSGVQPIQLPQPIEAATYAAHGKFLRTAGWGLTEVNGWKSRELLEVIVPVVDYAACKAHYGAILPVGNLCAGEKGKDSCTWDSGGPLYVRKTGSQAVQIGIVSFGDSCGKAKVPGVYTPVIDHLTWITETRKPKPCTAADVLNNIC